MTYVPAGTVMLSAVLAAEADTRASRSVQWLLQVPSLPSAVVVDRNSAAEADAGANSVTNAAISPVVPLAAKGCDRLEGLSPVATAHGRTDRSDGADQQRDDAEAERVDRLVDGSGDAGVGGLGVLHACEVEADDAAVVHHEVRQRDEGGCQHGPSGAELVADPDERRDERERVSRDVGQQGAPGDRVAAEATSLVTRL